jgi:hypothetical protein
VVVPAAYSVVAEITEQRLRPMLRRFVHY